MRGARAASTCVALAVLCAVASIACDQARSLPTPRGSGGATSAAGNGGATASGGAGAVSGGSGGAEGGRAGTAGGSAGIGGAGGTGAAPIQVTPGFVRSAC